MRHVFQFSAENAGKAEFERKSSRCRLLTRLPPDFATENLLPERDSSDSSFYDAVFVKPPDPFCLSCTVRCALSTWCTRR